MGKNSGIEWTDHTFNPWWGCIKVSPGCEHCYAEGLSQRFGNNIWGPAATTNRRTFPDKHWNEPLKWDRDAAKAGVRAKVFCASMADVFEDHPQVITERARLFELIERTPNLHWLLLTKRPQNILPMIGRYLDDNFMVSVDDYETIEAWFERMGDRVWIGTSVEDQKRADERIPHLLTIPAAVRFLSVEPLLGPVDLWGARYKNPDGSMTGAISTWANYGFNWVIAGGESGPHKRPIDLDWVRRIRDDCKAAGVAFFMKQVDKVQPIPDDLQIKEFPYAKGQAQRA